MYKRERTTPCKPFGPKKKLIDALLATLSSEMDAAYETALAHREAEDLVFFTYGGRLRVLEWAHKAVHDALWYGKLQGTIERSRRLTELLAWADRDRVTDREAAKREPRYLWEPVKRMTQEQHAAMHNAQADTWEYVAAQLRAIGV